MRKIRKYLTKNPGAVFIAGFQTLLLLCAAFLIQGNSGLANDVALYAYCLLIVGVILQTISFIKDKGTKGEGIDEKQA